MIVRAAVLAILLTITPCLAADLDGVAHHLHDDMAQREAWVTHAGFPPSYRVDETAKVLLIDLDAADLPRRDEAAVLDRLNADAPTEVQKAAIAIVRGQIAHDR